MNPRTLIVILAALMLAACAPVPQPAPGGSAQPPGVPSDTPAGSEAEEGYPVEIPTDTGSGYPLETPETGFPPPYPEPSQPAADLPCQPGDPSPMPMTFSSEDGLELAGTFYAPADCAAPIVLLLHQFGGSKEDWTDLALWLQNRPDEVGFASGGLMASLPAQYAWFPAMPPELSFGVFAFDFRGHGESGSSGDWDPQGFLMDARAALAFAKSLPGVDPTRAILIGASIGADASVDTCLLLDGTSPAAFQENQNCIGAMPLSPGSFLEVSFEEVVNRLGELPFDMQIHCVAAGLDGDAPDLCSLTPGDHFQGTVYPGRSEHGVALLMPGLDPDIGQVLLDFLLRTLEE